MDKERDVVEGEEEGVRFVREEKGREDLLKTGRRDFVRNSKQVEKYMTE